MPCFYVDTFSQDFAVPATEGIDLPDVLALERYMQRALTAIAQDEGSRCDAFSAFARDAAGRHIMTVTLAMTTSPPLQRRTGSSSLVDEGAARASDGECGAVE